jgi:hypothetical protein
VSIQVLLRKDPLAGCPALLSGLMGQTGVSGLVATPVVGQVAGTGASVRSPPLMEQVTPLAGDGDMSGSDGWGMVILFDYVPNEIELLRLRCGA